MLNRPLFLVLHQERPIVRAIQHHNGFVVFERGCIWGRSHVVAAYLKNAYIATLDFSQFSTLVRLRALEVGFSVFDDQDLISIGSNDTLEFLFAARTLITDASIDVLMHFKQLKILNLSGRSVSSHGLDSLRRRLTRCNITA